MSAILAEGWLEGHRKGSHIGQEVCHGNDGSHIEFVSHTCYWYFILTLVPYFPTDGVAVVSLCSACQTWDWSFLWYKGWDIYRFFFMQFLKSSMHSFITSSFIFVKYHDAFGYLLHSVICYVCYCNMYFIFDITELLLYPNPSSYMPCDIKNH